MLGIQVFTGLLFLSPVMLSEDPVPPNPFAPGVSTDNRERYLDGVLQAEQLREQLLTSEERGTVPAAGLAEAIVRFRDRSAPALEGRPGLEQFDLAANEILARIEGTGREIDVSEGFEHFAGRWYGQWDQMQVDHDWSRTVVFDPPEVHPETDSLRVRATQSAWVGDGFGWNVVAILEPGDGEVILGTVYHVEDGQRDQIRFHQPLVGVDAGPGRLIWITAGAVYLEEIFKGAPDQPEHYAITGFRYDWQEGTVVAQGEAFQAIYTREPDNRPAWFTFPIDLKP